MNTATFDIRNQIRERLHELQISAATFAALAGTTDSTFSDFMRSKRSLGHAREQAMLRLLDKLIAYSDAARPLMLPFDDIVLMRRLLKYFDEQDISPEQVRAAILMLMEPSSVE